MKNKKLQPKQKATKTFTTSELDKLSVEELNKVSGSSSNDSASVVLFPKRKQPDSNG